MTVSAHYDRLGMTEALALRQKPQVLAYLDPASWAVGGQFAFGAAAWAWLRVRRSFRRFPLWRRRPPRLAAGAREVQPFEAIEILTKPGDKPRLLLVMEGSRDWPYLAAVVHELCSDSLDIWCVSAGDVPLDALHALGVPFRYVARTEPLIWIELLAKVHADVVITTLTDLGSAQFPKSPQAYYAYVFHSPVSTHVAYPEDAFDEFDTMFCPGEIHARELACRDKITKRAQREIVVSGYPYLDNLCDQSFGVDRGARRIVLAPSWSSDDQVNSLWADLADGLRQAGFEVTFRPHPETIKRSPDALSLFSARFAGFSNVDVDLGADAGRGFAGYGAMITDWSGAAIEFALSGLGRVAFVDTPRKIRNVHWDRIASESVEAQARPKLGPVVSINDALSLVDYFVGIRQLNPGLPTRVEADCWMAHHGVAASVISSNLRRRLTARS